MWLAGIAAHLVSAVVGRRSEDREEGVVLPPSDGVGVRDSRPLGDLELAEATDVLIFATLPSICILRTLLPWK